MYYTYSCDTSKTNTCIIMCSCVMYGYRIAINIRQAKNRHVRHTLARDELIYHQRSFPSSCVVNRDKFFKPVKEKNFSSLPTRSFSSESCFVEDRRSK